MMKSDPKPLKDVIYLGRRVVVVDDGINAKNPQELIEKICWCESVGLKTDPLRLQEFTFRALILNGLVFKI